jgi:tyrosine-protein kinase Etk/Wzc
MSTTPENSFNPKSVKQDIDFYKIFKVFFSRWYWIALCILIAIIIGKINLLYTSPMYQTYGQLKLQESNPTINTVGLSNQNYNYTDRIQAEGFIIRSNEVLLNAISNLDYKVSYFLKGRIRTSDIYPNKPFLIQIVQQDSVKFDKNPYIVDYIDNRKFAIRQGENAPKMEYKYGDTIWMGQMAFRITTKIPERGEYSFKFNTKDDFLGRASNVTIGEAAKFTNVMNLIHTDANPVFSSDILNEIMKEYVKYDVILKRKSARQTVDFIDSQLGLVEKKSDTAGSNFANYKTQNKIIDPVTSSSINTGKLTDLENQKNSLNLQLIGINQLEQQLQLNKDRININLGLEGEISQLLGDLVSRLNSLIAGRQEKLTQGYKASSFPVMEIDKQIVDVKNSIRNNISSLKQRVQKILSVVTGQIATTNRDISQLPSKEQKYVGYQTKFEVNNKVVTYLTEKKLESEMNAAAVVPGAAIVNLAYPNTNPISPKSSSIYSFAAMVGFACGIGLILLVRFLNPYIYDKETVESLTNTPIIGVIRKFPEFIDKDSRQALSLAKPKSVFAESVRSVRTNLSFLAANKKSKTICITSEISGEGKSFVTVNLAGTLALIDKKVILIAADLRKSKLHKVFGSDNKVGLSSFLTGQKTLEEVMIHDKVHNIDFIPSGPVPPNPSELLHTDAMKKLLTLLAPQYDYVLVDTAPVGLVSDAIPLIRQSDVNLFVIRSGKSQFRAAAIPERLSKEYGLSNLAIVLNAFGDDALHSNYYTTDYSRGGGNSTYYYSDYSGYAGAGYYDNDPKKWWEFWKKK